MEFVEASDLRNPIPYTEDTDQDLINSLMGMEGQ
jgi:hypothetical protein